MSSSSDMATCPKSDSEPERIKRKASRNCPGSRSCLPDLVSYWERSHIESVLHIYYGNLTSEIPAILGKIPKIKELCSRQKQHFEILRNTNFGPNLTLKGLYVHNRRTKKLLQEALLELEANFNLGDSTCSSTESSLSPYDRAFICIRTSDYISSLNEFLDTIYEKGLIDNADEEMDSIFKAPFICEETYSKIVSAFAAMCGLQVQKGDKDNRSVWEHLRGKDNVIIAKPDFRFFCTGENFNTCNNLLTVTEVKKKAQFTEDRKLKRKQQDDLEKRAKRRCKTVSSSSSLSSTSIESGDQMWHLKDMDKSLPQTEKSNRPWLQWYVGKSTLGQHAGELLLDLHTYMKQRTDVQKPSILTMPGMIVDKTMVYLTLLEISYQHYEKLNGTEQLTSEDRATIYYSEPYDIFDEHEREILIHTFLRLNNTQ